MQKKLFVVFVLGVNSYLQFTLFFRLHLRRRFIIPTLMKKVKYVCQSSAQKTGSQQQRQIKVCTGWM